MALTEKEVLQALSHVRFPGFSRDIVSAGAVRSVVIADDRLRIELDPGSAASAATAEWVEEVRRALVAPAGARAVEVALRTPAGGAPSLRMAAPPSVAAAGALDRRLIPHVRHAVAVASGKGGVGKSTVAVNLAVALAREGARVGLLDADIYGPSIPLMMGVDEPPVLTEDRRLVPFEREGVRFMSLGFLVDPESAVIWRGPMVMKAIEQLLGDVEWGHLDVLVIDLPPGTGDAQLTLSQKIRLSGAVIVTTPQDVALADAIKGIAMFRKVDVPVLGIVENMSYFLCPHCSARSEIFDHGGGRREAARLGVPFLGEVPLDVSIRVGGDCGRPIVASQPDSAVAKGFSSIARSLLVTLGGAPDTTAETASDGHDRGGLFDRFRRLRRDTREA